MEVEKKKQLEALLFWTDAVPKKFLITEEETLEYLKGNWKRYLKEQERRRNESPWPMDGPYLDEVREGDKTVYHLYDLDRGVIWQLDRKFEDLELAMKHLIHWHFHLNARKPKGGFKWKDVTIP